MLHLYTIVMALFKYLSSTEDCGQDEKKRMQSGLEWVEKSARCAGL